MLEKLKQHPWIIAALAGVFLLVLIFSSSGSSSGTAATTSASSGDPNGDQLQAYMAQLNLQGQALSASANSTDQQTAAALEVAKLQSSSTDLANTLAAQVAEYTTAAQATTTQNHDTLSAQVANNQIAAGVQNTQITANALTQQAQINAGTLSQAIYSQTAETINGQNQNAAIQSQLIYQSGLDTINGQVLAAQNKGSGGGGFWQAIFG